MPVVVETIRLIVALPQPLLVHGIVRVAEVGCAMDRSDLKSTVLRY